MKLMVPLNEKDGMIYRTTPKKRKKKMSLAGESSNCYLSACLLHGTDYCLLYLDPARIKLVSDAIDLALEQVERRKLKQEPSQPRPFRQEVRQVGICNLPADILYMISGYLPSQTIAALENAFNIHFGGSFGRSRISTKLFHEKKGVAGEDLDWRRLCLKLEKRLEKSDALATRRYILERLDEVLSVVKELQIIRSAR